MFGGDLRAHVALHQRVHAGEFLGYEGRTGNASGCHLHYGLFSPFERSEIDIGIADPLSA